MTVLQDARRALDRAFSINRVDPGQWEMMTALNDLANALDRLELERSYPTSGRSQVALERLLFEVRTKLEAAVSTADFATSDAVDKSVNEGLIQAAIDQLAEVTEGEIGNGVVAYP